MTMWQKVKNAFVKITRFLGKSLRFSSGIVAIGACVSLILTLGISYFIVWGILASVLYTMGNGIAYLGGEVEAL